MKSWYRITAQAENEVEVLIYDEIGYWGITAKDFITDFRKIPQNAKVSLRINSPGGDVFDGLAIYNLIRAHQGEVITTIDGLAASMASMVALAGSKVVMPENAYMMIHNPWSLAIGDADDMRDMAELLDKVTATGVNIYVKKSGQEEEKIRELMKEETWLTAAEARELGLADEIAEPQKLAARASWKSKFKNLPLPTEAVESEVESPSTEQPALSGAEVEALVKAGRAEAEKNAQEIFDLCAKAGVPEAAADFLSRLTAGEVRERLADVDKIRAACVAAKLPDRASRYIKAGLSLTEVRADLFSVLQVCDPHEINSHLGPDGTLSAKRAAQGTPMSAEIYAMRNKKR